MANRKRRQLLAGIGSAGLSILAGCTGSNGGNNNSGGSNFELRVGTASQGTPAFTHGQALQALARDKGKQIRFTAQQTDGFQANLALMAQGDYNTVFTYPGLFDLAVRGEEMFDEKRNVFGYFGPTNFLTECYLVTPKNSDIEYYEDITDKTVANYQSGTGIYAFSKIFLNSIGITENDFNRIDIPLSDYASALESGRIDVAGFFSYNRGDIIFSSFQELEARNNVQPLKLKDENFQKAQSNSVLSMGRTKINSSSDFSNTTTPFWGLTSTDLISPEVPASAVNELTRLMVENSDTLNSATETFIDSSNPNSLTAGLRNDYPAHPGFENFLKERNWWQDQWMTADS